MDKAFEVHMLNEQGKQLAVKLANEFDMLFAVVTLAVGRETVNVGRELELVRTKLEEACFFAKKAMARQPHNQETK